jgi:hypothetical protein
MDRGGKRVLNDSRIRQAKAAVDDARTLAADLADELPNNNHLTAARFSLNCALQHLKRFEDSDAPRL